MLRNNLAWLLLATCIVLAPLFAGCSSGGSGQGQVNSVIGWPFATSQLDWTIENGYNTGPDHSGYELYSFDFQRRSGTTGQTVLSPVTGTSIDFGDAYPYDGSSGKCVSITVDGYESYHVLVCHLINPLQGKVSRGSALGTVSGGQNGDHIHITLYYLPLGTDDAKANAAARKAMPFSDPWTIAGCNYPPNGQTNQWKDAAVPCANSGTQTASPTATADPQTLCRRGGGFASATAAAAVLGASFPRIPFPTNSLAVVIDSHEEPSFGTLRFMTLRVCSPALTPDAVASFFRTNMPQARWDQSSVFPTSESLNQACGTTYCWTQYVDPFATSTIPPDAGEHWVSLGQTAIDSAATVYQMNLLTRIAFAAP